MNKIILLGAGKSSGYLIDYLEKSARKDGFYFTVADQYIYRDTSLEEFIDFVQVDVNDDHKLNELIENKDLVISLLPPSYHKQIALKCLDHNCHFITASYNIPEIQSLHEKAKEKGLTFIMEAGFDPGLDHMGIMDTLQAIKDTGGQIKKLKSYAGGLLTEDSEDNPWQYKFTWNPANVVLAGQGKPAKFLENNRIKIIPYHKLFERTEDLELVNHGSLEAYINRDSLHYKQLYDLNDIETLYRGTLRKPGFCKAWNLLVQLGLTNNEAVLENSENLTYEEVLKSMIPETGDKNLLYSVIDYLDIAMGDPAIKAFKWLDLISEEKPGLKKATPAQILQKRLEDKWKMEPNDKDLVIQHHIFEFYINNKYYRKTATLSLAGENKNNTAMARLVGLPLAITARNILLNNIDKAGVYIPNKKWIYEPVLDELAEHDIFFEYGN